MTGSQRDLIDHIEQEMHVVTEDLRAKQSSAGMPEPVDEDTKLKLAMRTSQAAVPGAFDCNQAIYPKSQDQILEISRMRVQQKQRDYVDRESRRPVQQSSIGEEQVIEGLHGRMSDFQKEMNRKDEIERELARRKRCKYIVGALVLLLVVIGVVVGVVVSIIPGASDGDGVPNTAAATATEALAFEICYLGASDQTARFTRIESVLATSESPVLPEAEINTAESTARAALCWLADIDEMPIQDAEGSEYEVIQRFAIVHLYFHFAGTTSLDSHRLSSALNWLTSGLHVCEWDGVGCDEHPIVTSLTLDKMRVIGAIPQEVALLSDLKFLELATNELSGTIPSELSLLTQLEKLRLHGNELTGEIPAALGSMTQLLYLDVGRNGLTGEIPSQLFSIPHLRVVVLDENNLTGALPQMLSNALELTHLSIIGNALTGTIPNLSGLQDLQLLQLVNLELLGTFPDISGCTKLKHLDITEIDLTGTVPTYIWSFQQLTTLALARTTLSGTIPSEAAVLTRLEKLIFDGANSFRGTLPSSFGDLSLLTHLSFGFLSGLSGTVPSELGQLTNLRYLYFPRAISGTIPSEVCTLSIANLQGPCARCDCCNICTHT